MQMRAVAVLTLALVAGCATPDRARPMGTGTDGWGDAGPMMSWQEAEEVEIEGDSGRGIGHRLLWYIPNRISDALDIVRARVRVGPGLSVGVRATEFADLYLGSRASVFVGIPGPRRERSFNWPFGFDTKSGIEVSVADATVEGGTNYGWLEFGLGADLLIVGLDIGVDPWEIVDFALGLVTIDFGEDDI